MNDVLEQDEIDALLKGVNSGEVDMSPKPVEDPSIARQYDFSTQTRIVRGRMPTLEMINERLARALRLSIFGMLRRSPEISVLGISTPKYAEYVPTLSVPTSLNMIRFLPLAGTGLMIFEAKLIFAVIDTYFGGIGRHAKIEGRDFTPTENQIIQMLLDQVIAAMQEAWSPVIAAKVEFINREMNPHFANLVSPTEIVVVSRLRLDIDGKGGEIHITLPYAMLEPLKDTLRAGMQSDRADREERWSQLLRNELEDSEVDLVTRLGSVDMTVSSLIDLRPGDIIPCEFNGNATVLADGIPLFSGELGQQRGKQVVRINEMNIRKSGNSLDAFVRKSA
ncbi:MAG: flagellar motor switch protein FliM [Steroidobacteraceae bacterium]